jgi:cellulose synthase/poly-beta-1,6-N-acetylglucosamine synthase-like glycosyltransferase
MTEVMFAITQGLFLGMLAVVIGSTIVGGVFLARERRRPPARLSFEPLVSVLIPAYNEARTIGPCLEALLRAGYPREKLDVIVVDDGSTDATREVVRAHDGVRLLRRAHGGKVAALNAALENARHEVLLCIDADTLLRPGSISEIVRPLADPAVAAVTGVAKVRNPGRLLGWFQSVEYLLNAFSRESFSSLFRLSPGICGALTCYRRSLLQRIGGFKAHTAAEDFDVAWEFARRGLAIVAARGAVGYTQVPDTLSSLVRQRVRWMKGCMQCFVKHRAVLVGRQLALTYLFAIQIFWIVYALASLPLIAYSFIYWLPLYGGSLLDLGAYVVRWFSLVGPVYMVVKIPEWGINYTYFFGVLAGLLSPVLMLVALLWYDRLTLRTALAISFYFPYTLLLSAMMVGSLGAYIRSGGKGAFVK